MTMKNAVDRFIDDTSLAHRIVHGEPGTVVPTEGGPVPSFATVIDDLGQVNQRISTLEDGQSGDRVVRAAWADLAAVPTSANGLRGASVVGDQGAHIDPVTGVSVPNSGDYIEAPAGWKWVRAESLARKLDRESFDKVIKGEAQPSYGLSFADNDGAVAVGITEDGTLVADAAQLRAAEVAGMAYDATCPMDYSHVYADSEGNVAGGQRPDGTLDYAAARFDELNGYPLDRFLRGQLGHHFAACRIGVAQYGQSNAQGHSPGLTTVAPHDALGFKAHATGADLLTLRPMTAANVSAGADREIPAFAAIDMFKNLIASEEGLTYRDHKYQPVCMNSAYGGYSIKQLEKDSAPYVELLGQVSAARTLSQGEGMTFKQLCTVWLQGEGDLSSSYGYYLSRLIALASNFDADCRSITGQVDPVHLLTYQVASVGADFQQTVALAQLDAASASPLISMVAPFYFVPFTDDVHTTAQGIRLFGAYFGLAMKHILVDQKKWEPLRPVRTTLQGRVLDVQFSKRGLVLDTTNPDVPAVPQFGFQVVGPSGIEIPITKATITQPDTITFVLAKAPPKGSSFWAGGKRVPAGAKGTYLGAVTNLRDSQGDQFVYEGRPLHNWCCISTLKI